MILSVVLLLALQEPQVPDGFRIDKVAESTFPMFATFDELGRLYVTESSGGDLCIELRDQVRKCVVRRFEDKDGDGVYETSVVFAEGLTPSMGLAWRDGKLYVADPPALVTLEDLDGDGKADRRTVILSGFGHRDNGSLHGLTFGPDGLLYMTTGQPDGYVFKQKDGTLLKGISGALLRCKPDGSDPEVVARGFENLVEVVFLPGGDIVGTCNWYQKPAGGIRDALVHLVDGGLYPYVPDQGTRLPNTDVLIPPLALFPAVALSGLARYHGTAFPEALRGNLFSAQHNSRKVQRHVLARNGSTYTAESVDFVTSENPDFHPSDVLEAPDGSLIVVDTGAWYVQHCPTGKIRNSRAPGGIYRVRFTGPRPGGKRAEQARIPVGLSPELLVKWLPDPAASRALARIGKPEAAPALAALLKSGDAPQRLGAAEALATCGTPDSLEAIWEALAGDLDPILEHALIHAALGITKGKFLLKGIPYVYVDHQRPAPRVRKAQIIILDQSEPGLKPEQLLTELRSQDPDLRRTALKILQRHPDWATVAAQTAEPWLRKLALSDDERASLLGIVVAFQTDSRIQEFIAAAMKREGISTRVALMEAMTEMTLPSLPAAWKEGLGAALSDLHPEVRLQAVRTIATLRLKDFDDRLAELSERENETLPLRLEALRALVGRRPVLSTTSAQFLIGQLHPEHEATVRLAAAEALSRATLGEMQLRAALRMTHGNSLISPSIFLPQLSKAEPDRPDGALQMAAESIRLGWRPSKTELGAVFTRLPEDVRKLIEKSGEEQQARLAQFEPLLKGGDPARGREVFAGKKVACATCHSVGTQGGKVGPDLTKVGATRAGRDLLESIVFPSSTFAQGYEPYLVLTQDGNVLSGLIARQSADAVALRDASGAEVLLRRDRIREMKRAEKSVMPEGLERAMSADEFRDLLAFLQSLK